MKAETSGIRAGIIGIGTLGREHARIYAASDTVSNVVLYDRIAERAAAAAERYGGDPVDSIAELLDACDLVSVCTPATHHYETVLAAFERGVHVLVEKPIAASYAEGLEMVRKADESGCTFQVGHIERFNGAFQAALPLLDRPLFIESHRLASFSPRGTDVSVVVDLMIHDIDLILTVLAGDRVTDIRASGTGVLTDSADIVNARIEFESGCVANITASRISLEPLRKMRFFQERLYLSMDLRTKTVEAYEKREPGDTDDAGTDPGAFIKKLPVDVDLSEPLQREIQSFIGAVASGDEPPVTGREACEALRIGEMILERIGGMAR
jgi:predicted dehydrogenase